MTTRVVSARGTGHLGSTAFRPSSLCLRWPNVKYWQGFMVVTDISLVGWMTTVIANPPWRSFVLALVAVGAISYGILDLHRRIERRIDRVGEL